MEPHELPGEKPGLKGKKEIWLRIFYILAGNTKPEKEAAGP